MQTLEPWLTTYDFSQPLSDTLADKYTTLKRRFQCAIDQDAMCIYWEPTPRGFRVPIVWPVRRLHGEYADNAAGRRRWAEKVAQHQQNGERLGDPFTPMDADIQCIFGGWLNPTLIRVIDFHNLAPSLRHDMIAKHLNQQMADYWRDKGKGHWNNDGTLAIHVECQSGATFEYIIDKTNINIL